ncbi:hypothetical protein E2C01_022299 [Portunus trituberculatus]|uniref:LolA-like domain-containing protein n=1 Tax=Portunus trituberculatus TaxID=210409 RepID=A0A5B7E4Z8_PORTR|nr:hypothetical protein [Portunus trituberculatus]
MHGQLKERKKQAAWYSAATDYQPLDTSMQWPQADAVLLQQETQLPPTPALPSVLPGDHQPQTSTAVTRSASRRWLAHLPRAQSCILLPPYANGHDAAGALGCSFAPLTMPSCRRSQTAACHSKENGKHPQHATGKRRAVVRFTWYDFYNQLTRVDSMTQLATPEFSVAGLTQVAVISDFRAGVEYIIDKTLGNCTTMNLTDNGYSFTSPDGHHSISDPLHVFGIEGGPNLTYQGMASTVFYHLTLPCLSSWCGALLLVVQAGWMEDTGNQVKSLPVPVLIKVHNVYGDETMTVYLDLQENIFKFEENDPSMSVFDITPCFTGHDHIRRFQMAFSSDYRDDFDRDPALFTQEITDSLLVYLRIPFLRLQHPLVEYVKDFNHLFYEFTLLDQPQVDMEMPQYVGKPLAEVVEELKLSMYTLVIVIIDEQGHPKKMKPIANSLRELFEDGCYSRDTSYPPFHDLQNPRPVTDVPRVTSNDWIEKTTTEERKEDEVKGSVFTFLMEMQQWVRSSSDEETYYTPGDMAGMAVGMLLLGLLLGTVVMLVILRKMGLSNDLEYIPMNSRRN